MGGMGQHADSLALQWVSAFRSAQAAERSARAAEESAEAARAQIGDVRKAAGASERSATAAEQSAEATKALAMTGQRAWLSYEKLDISTRDQNRLPTFITSTLKNGGSTPALNIEMYQCWKLYAQIPERLDFSTGASGSRGGIGPGSMGQIPSDIALTREQDSSVRQNKERLLVYGFATYEDVFGGRHKTEWCLRYLLNTQEFTFSPKFNDSN